jgi:hypothetical protein
MFGALSLEESANANRMGNHIRNDRLAAEAAQEEAARLAAVKKKKGKVEDKTRPRQRASGRMISK